MDLFQTLGLGPKPPDENVVFYAIYPDPAAHNPLHYAQQLSEASAQVACASGGVGSSCMGQQGAGMPLEALRADCLAVVLPLLRGYVWQKDAFNLTPSTQKAPPWTTGRRRKKGPAAPEDEPPCVWGTLRFGDNVEDEWWAVYLLLEVTRRLQGVMAKVWDNDGEFLLIEAAYALPRWLKPETATNRVWLKEGKVNIIPPPSPRHPSLPSFPSVHQALQILSQGSVPTAAPKVHAQIQERLQGYPAAALQQGCHRARVVLPLRLAAVLQHEPQLVAAAVEAFYYRDADDMKAAARMSRFPPTDSPVTTLVPFNRCQYAQLMQQRFAAPRGVQQPPPGHPMFKASDLGFKLTAGFEILASRSARLRGGSSSSQAPAAGGNAAGGSAPPAGDVAAPGGDAAASGGGSSSSLLSEAQLQSNPAWSAYLSSLERNGYFQGNIRGSARYRELLSAAVADFARSEAFARGAAEAGEPGARLASVLQGPASAMTSQDFQSPGAEDDDSWLEGQAGTLEGELERRQAEMDAHTQRRSHKASKVEDAEEEVDAADVAKRFRSFVDHMAGMEGAEVPKAEREVLLDAAAFLSELQQALGLPLAGGAGGSGRAQLRRQGHGGPVARREVEDEDDDEDDWSTTEGSSFFSDDDGDDDGSGDEEEEGGEQSGTFREPDLLPVAPAASNARQRQQAPGSSCRPSLQRLQEAWEVKTATDSDDDYDASDDALGIDGDESGSEGEDDEDGEAGFMEAYSAALNAQLRGTTLAQTFERAAAHPDSSSGRPQAGAAAAANAKEVDHGGDDDDDEEEGDELRPVDLDLNLVKNLLKSVTSQQGMAGPASNLAGLMGLALPHGLNDE